MHCFALQKEFFGIVFNLRVPSFQSCFEQGEKRRSIKRSGNCFAGVEQYCDVEVYRTKSVLEGNQRNYRISSEMWQSDATCVSVSLAVFDKQIV
ncbi:uncharacterized protein MONOS_2643 [Monocercomonoides exilis]|uniref:uncharacterized protein n=1 Tax=Monocercomonoides exilis TaxID=2049356 RepID=UPI003559CD88|nr:hypothetical protein MONOS_2643 [Monocercomonoides exilis]|eukprot:MONOS_2643.1-p1 / transcript=MONOS_2643.1 / gene=MONOS_2643 / organism=Monocercomonoides_exilis_PA203 / gene_product=unspecified product / transcript_product=unspecified product / location=Mono_scaffold00055:156720-157053(+) / protein_length=94 / sequence_SO=supercontig / SO=protein_coding / is_pseudo=false